jgi:hypothetical protein
MKRHLFFVLALLISGSSFVNGHDVLATNSTVFIKPSQGHVLANQSFTLDFYVSEMEDLFGFQIDIATSLKPGALPVEPENIQSPFELTNRSLFEGDMIFINQFDSVKEITTLLVTKPIQETSGYLITRPTHIASLSLVANMDIVDIATEIKLSDDLLSVQLGITNISVKLSNANGGKITYAAGVPDITQPEITITNKTVVLALNSGFDVLSAFTATDDESAAEDLVIYVSNFHRLDTVGEYIVTIKVTDEFYNATLAWFFLVVGDPYIDIEVTYVLS